MTVGILAVLFGVSAYGASLLQESLALQSVDREISNIFTSAARRARIGELGDSWGVYIPYNDVSRSASTITLFRGDSYETRDSAFDQIININEEVKFTYVDFSGTEVNTGNDREIVFDYLSGNTSQFGSVTVQWYEKLQTITIDSSGFIVRNTL